MATKKNKQKLDAANEPLWRGPSLLVPIKLDAMVISTMVQNLPWQYNPNSYQGLKSYDSVEPLPFSGQENAPPLGVILHWSLPRALKNGVEDDQGRIAYPALPNRWLIIRSHEDSPRSGSHALQAWVVQSDFIDKTAATGSNLFPDITGNTTAVMRIGKSVAQKDWPGETSAGPEFTLTAIGAGDVTFTANVSNIKDIFSFRDPLQGFETNSNALFTYRVIGWYSDPAKDPLYGKAGQPWTTKQQWLDLMGQFKWSVGGEDNLKKALNDAGAWYAAHDPQYPWSQDRDKYPSRTICHGMVFKLKWLGRDGSAKELSGVPWGNDPKPKVAIGNTAIDALAALLEDELKPSEDKCYDGGDITELLEAFQYELLSSYTTADGKDELIQAIFNAWFGSKPAGTLWEITEPEQQTPRLTKEQATLLAGLNAKQSELDGLHRKLASLQWETYALWWKVGKRARMINPPDDVPSKKDLENLQGESKKSVEGCIAAIGLAKQEADAREAGLRAAIRGTSLSLAKSAAPRFAVPNEPVVLIYGAHRSFKHGERDQFSEEGYVFTRFTGQTLNAIKVQAKDSTERTITASDLGWSPTLPNLNRIPKEVSDLIIESFFLDTFNADSIAAKAASLMGKEVSAEREEKQQTIIWNSDITAVLDRQSVAELSGLVGTIPSKISVDLWRPPWSPLYLEWQVTWHPSSKEPEGSLKKWKFDGSQYQWDSGTPDTSVAISYMGRTLLTPKASDDFVSRLNQFINEYGEGRFGKSDQLDKLLPRLRQLCDKVKNWDILSQSLSGFNQYLIMRNPTMHAKPELSLREALGQNTDATPYPAYDLPAFLKKGLSLEDAIKSVTDWIQVLSYGPDEELLQGAEAAALGAGISAFFPIRSGHFQIRQLQVVDDFGQIFVPIKDWATYYPIRGRGLCAKDNKRLLQLPPRLVQPARLRFEQVSAENDRADTCADPTANPVSGWMLPNHLDRGLTVYDAAGEMVGSLTLVGNPPDLRLRWNPAPGSDSPLGAPPNIKNRHMRGFVAGLLAQERPAAAFLDFLRVIDATLWTTSPWGSSVDKTLSVLVGRPLAMVRARLELQLSGRRVYDQKWAASGKDVTKNYDNVLLPIKLGRFKKRQDGLMGYFLGDSYQRFSAVFLPDARESNYLVSENVSLNFGPQSQAFISMVLDPFGVVHATNGVLPESKTQLAAAYIDNPLARMEVTFRTGPLLTPPEAIRMPTPADIKGKWSWIQRSGVTLWQNPAEIIDTNQQARLEDAPAEFVEGWMKLSEAFKKK